MSDFAKAIAVVIAVHEGGFQNRTDDPGNFRPDGTLAGTKYGISARSYPAEDIGALTLERAEDLYMQTYGGFAQITDQRILTKVLDLAVNMQGGVNGPATRCLQMALDNLGDKIVVDGEWGKATLGATNVADPAKLLPEICTSAVAHYRAIEAANPTMRAWFASWDKRALWMPPQDGSISA